MENRINQFSLRTVRGQVEGIEVVVAEEEEEDLFVFNDTIEDHGLWKLFCY